ncbi:pectinesterase [Hydrogenispora ethanolica]|jgi:pectinesterase|uniref:Pectinesterase n=1 Tax=Hydrogenispora ethanolica TaxID=1082276 RepID=A0A4R1QSF4_HYDET|nr:pectinesterase family protein [Hydrogenispora ethanolica]TCL56829.1 pectinesterase [Hydrogenispora ethanolica]
MIIVAPDGSGDFRSVAAAFAALPAATERVVIYIKNGVYREKLKLDRASVSLIGESAAHTILTYDDSAKKPLPSGEPMNTFNSYTFYIGGPDFTAENLTFENSAGDGDRVGQAIAVYADADRVAFRNCRFLGCQDTLFTGPLPKHPTPKGLNLVHPALGSGAEEYRGTVRQYYQDCWIQGDIDFIFGSATALFQGCQIFVNDRGQAVNGYITAGSTAPWQAFGYVFRDCRIGGAAGAHSVYLGRPWRDYAKTAFIDCWMDKLIAPAGWHNWDLPHREATVGYAEYHSQGPGASDAARVPWARRLTPEEAERYTLENILSGWDPTCFFGRTD